MKQKTEIMLDNIHNYIKLQKKEFYDQYWLDKPKTLKEFGTMSAYKAACQEVERLWLIREEELYSEIRHNVG